MTYEMICRAIRCGHEYGLAEAEVAIECGRWPDWTNGAYAGWLPGGDQTAKYDDLVDRSARAAYEAVRDAITTPTR